MHGRREARPRSARVTIQGRQNWKYEYVAEHPLGSFHIQPTCWLIGAPLLTRILPFSTYRNFELLNICFFTLCGWLIYLWLLAVPRTHDEAVLGVLMFYSMGAVVKLVIGGVETPDPGSYFFTLLAIYAIYKENDYLCATALALGMSTKETLMVVTPLHYSLKANSLIDFSRLKRSVLVAIPAICVFAGIRIAIPAWNDHEDYVKSLPFIYTQVMAGDVQNDIVTAFHGVVRTYRGMPLFTVVRLLLWGSLGVELFLPFFDLKTNRNIFLRWSPYWAAIVATLLIALNPDRRVGSLFPVLIVTGLNGLGALGARLRASTKDFQIVFLLQFALLMLRKDVAVVPFDLVAAVFLASLCWLVARARIRGPVPELSEG
jgi:hypothetical protein